jgi:hypothetical protein
MIFTAHVCSPQDVQGEWTQCLSSVKSVVVPFHFVFYKLQSTFQDNWNKATQRNREHPSPRLDSGLCSVRVRVRCAWRKLNTTSSLCVTITAVMTTTTAAIATAALPPPPPPSCVVFQEPTFVWREWLDGKKGEDEHVEGVDSWYGHHRSQDSPPPICTKNYKV